MIRLPGICNFDDSTTVLAHIRLIGVSGMGLKAPDLLASYSCSACHDVCDSRRLSANLSRDQVQLAHYQGMARTIAYWLKEGLIHAD